MKNVPRYFALLILTIAQLLTGISGESSPIDSVFIRFYGNSVDNYTDESLNKAELLVAKIDNNKPTVFYIHGHSESVQNISVITIVKGYLQRGDHNILAVDYRNISRMPYIQSVKLVPDLGVALASALDKMVEAKLDSEKLHVVGHSLGGQVAGQVGRNTHFQIPRITGLDPAGPLFYFFSEPLSAKDARFVDVIHTDAAAYGNAERIATADFYPNGGHRIQPGCPVLFFLGSDGDFCSHYRSWIYYAESLNNENAFMSVKCSSHFQYATGSCKNNEKVPMGYATPTNINGSYYLSTAAHSPYGLN